MALKGSNDRPLSIGFYVNWDDNSYPALKRALPNLDWLIPTWLSLEGSNLELKTDVDDKVLNFIQAAKPIQDDLAKELGPHAVKILGLVRGIK